MSNSDSPVFFFDNADPQMQQAYEQARRTFGYLWRELAWERRRIVPGLDLACVKAPFFDSTEPVGDSGQPEAEQMWVSDIEFDGQNITGFLINSPHWLTSVQEGDSVLLQVGGITDWMYGVHGRVYGAFTVNLIRSRMPPSEMAQHDEAWGLDFGDPHSIDLIPPNDDGVVDLNADHPMAINMVPSLVEYLQQGPANIHALDDAGWTLLHHQSLAGSTSNVTTLLQYGADPNLKTRDGVTPLQLANSLGWGPVAQLLLASGAQ